VRREVYVGELRAELLEGVGAIRIEKSTEAEPVIGDGIEKIPRPEAAGSERLQHPFDSSSCSPVDRAGRLLGPTRAGWKMEVVRWAPASTEDHEVPLPRIEAIGIGPRIQL